MKQQNNKIRLIPLLLTMLFCSSGAMGAIVKGLVTDESGEPLIGVTVMQKGHPGIGTSTDLDGNYTLDVNNPKTAVLLFSYVGMTPREEKVNNRQTVNAILTEDTQMMDEVVIVGYGSQKKESVVGAIAQTSGETLQKTGGVSSVGAALTGNLPGVVTSQTTGKPGDEDPKIVIRGVSSWNNSEPLVLVDGVERPMSSVDVSSVKSISVLKDASATAVFGVKGANGVILITTKRGTEGRANINVGMSATMKVVSKLPEKYNSYNALAIRNRAIERELGLTPESWSSITPSEILDKYLHPANLEEAERYPDVDWQNELFKKTAMSYNPYVNISGGTKFVKYYASIDFLHEGDLFREFENNRGYTAGYGFNRINVRSNLDFQLTPTTLLKVNLSGSHGQQKGPYDIDPNSWHETQLWRSAYGTPPDAFLPVYSDGIWGYYNPDPQSANNSIANLAIAGIGKRTTTRINTDFSLEQDLKFITPGLKAGASVSWDNSFLEFHRGVNDLNNSTQYKWINPATGETIFQQPLDAKTQLDFNEQVKWTINGGEVQNWSTVRNLFYQFQLNYGRKFGDHDVTAMGVFNRTERATGSEFAHYREDWAFRATYNYADRYFVEFNGAYNGSEKFDSKHRFEFFPSGAVGWRLNAEPFMKATANWLDNFKIRYSIGQVGDDNVADRWLYATQWAFGSLSDGNNLNFSTTPGSNYSPYTWYKISKLGNPNIHWEKSLKQNLGVDFGFLNGLIAGTVELFYEKRNDILINGNRRAIPSYFGMSAPSVNYGRVRTKGYEIELRLNKTFGDVHLWGNFSMTHAENKILSFDDPAMYPDYQKSAGFAIGQDHVNYTNGYAKNWDDVIAMTQHQTNDGHKLPGQYFTVDYNGDGVIDDNDKAPYGYSDTPQNTYNATIGGEWKGWSLYVQMYGVTNVQRTVVFSSFSGHLNTVYNEGSYWSAANPDADVPLPRWNSTPSYNTGWDSVNNHYDGSYFRLKNVEIAYTWTKGWIKHLGLSNLKIYLSGNNLLQYSRMPDDRESNFGGNGNASEGAYPTVRRFTLGFKFDI